MGKNRTDSDNRIAVLARAYLAWLAGRKYSPKSISTYAGALKDAVAWLEEQGVGSVQDIQQAHITAYRSRMVERQWKPASIQVYLRACKSFLGYLEDTQRIFANPMAGMVVFEHPRPLGPTPTEEEMRLVLSAPDIATPVGVRDRALLETLYGTGARRAEMLNLKLADVDLKNESVRLLGKGQRERIVPLGKEAAHWVRKYAQEARPALLKAHNHDALWIGFNARPLGYEAFRIIVRRYGRHSGIRTPITPHSIRRACASHMLSRGAHPVQIQMLLGHASMRHLSQYLRLSIAELQAVHARSKPGA